MSRDEARLALVADMERRKALQAGGKMSAATLRRDDRGRFLARGARVEMDVQWPRHPADVISAEPQDPGAMFEYEDEAENSGLGMAILLAVIIAAIIAYGVWRAAHG